MENQTDSPTMDGILKAYEALLDQARRSMLWYIVSPHVPAVESDGEGIVTAGYYAIRDCGCWTVLVHSDNLQAFLATAASSGLTVREVDKAEWMRRNEWRMRQLLDIRSR